MLNLKKIRCLYWKMRDRGKGKQFILFSLVLVLSVVSVGSLIGKGIYTSIKNHGENAQVKSEENSSASSDASNVSGSAVSVDLEETEDAQVDVQVATSTEAPIDASVLDGFLGFMSDDAYANMTEQIEKICRERGCKSAKKLNYQETNEGSFDVVSFILLSDGSVYQCNYNLKSSALSIATTTYTEADMVAKSNAKEQAELETLQKQQQEDKKKAEAEKKKKEAAKKKAAKKANKKTNKKSMKKK